MCFREILEIIISRNFQDPPGGTIFCFNWTFNCKSPKKRAYAQILRSKMSAHVISRTPRRNKFAVYWAFQVKLPAKAAICGHFRPLPRPLPRGPHVCALTRVCAHLPVPSERREGESTPMGALDRPYEGTKGTTYVEPRRRWRERRTWYHVGGVRASSPPFGRFGGFPLREPGARPREAAGHKGAAAGAALDVARSGRKCRLWLGLIGH